MSSQLFACPFCRELYSDSEADVCPHCDVVLRPLHDLPPSYEIREQEEVEWERTPPQDRTLPFTYFARGRGLLLGLSVLGLGLFFTPWIVLTKPELLTLSGYTLAQSRGFWFAGGAVGWFVSIPLIITRRTITRMRGVRVILTMFAATTAGQALILYFNAPTSDLIPLAYTWGWGFYASALVSVVAVPVAATFGGKVDDLPADLGRELRPEVAAETSGENTLH